MTKEFEELAIRAVKCDGWKWMPGARDRHGNIFLRTGEDDDAWVIHSRCPEDGADGARRSEMLPDFSDAATLGCLEALVCKQLGASFLTIGMHHSGGPGGTRGVGIWVERGSGARLDDGRTIREVSKGPDKASALVAALELGTLAR